MRLRVSPFWSSRLSLPKPLAWLELGLILLIAVQAARLLWVLVQPIEPVGAYEGAGAGSPPVATLGNFDPFFRLAPASGPIAVTSLSLKLHGVREDRATGRGSAILALPDGTQGSFAVGEEIIPGVKLAEVRFDSVTIDRQRAREQIFLDQPEATATAAAPPPTAPAPASPAPATAQAPVPNGPPIGFSPRERNGRVDGIKVNAGSKDGGQAFRAAGFAPGDVIVSVNGRPISSLDQARALAAGSGGQADIIVDRGGRAVAMKIRLDL